MAHESLNVSTTSGGSKPMPCLSPDFMPLLSPTRMDRGRDRKKKVLLELQIVSIHHFEQTTRYAVEALTADVLNRVWYDLEYGNVESDELDFIDSAGTLP